LKTAEALSSVFFGSGSPMVTQSHSIALPTFWPVMVLYLSLPRTRSICRTPASKLRALSGTNR
jgi:hypothetical protein